MSRKRAPNTGWKSRLIEPNLFFHNVEPRNPGSLATSVFRELSFFYSYLDKAIKSMSVERYGLRWEKDESLRYRIKPTQRIKVQKPQKRILLFTLNSEFSAEIPLQREDGTIIESIGHESHDDGVVVLLDEKVRLDPNETVFYRMKPVDWKPLSLGLSMYIEYLEDREGIRYKIQKRKEGSDYFEFDMKDRTHPDTELFAAGVRLDYDEKTIKTLMGVELRDSEGKLNYFIVSDKKYIIESPRKIKDALFDQDGRDYSYQDLSAPKGRSGVWIVLQEPERAYEHADEDHGSLVDIFFELVFSAINFEVWEKYDVNFRKPQDKDSRIEIITTRREEAKILLKREPTSELIFPPKNTYQLVRQREAVRILSRSPAPEHRGLLRLFEPYDTVEWESVFPEYNREDINWRILTESGREGTDEQCSFVLKCLNTPDFAILEGPPGSGKTTAIAELVFQLLNTGKRVLLSASTHVAIDNVIESLSRELKESGGLEQNGIIPLRVGREESISEDVKEYQIDNRIERMRDVIGKENWFSSLPKDKQEENLEDLVIWSSNLVCGTIIGVLQYPPFKRRRYDYVTPEFDYLIIDEASKTTFQEFLVPAIHAKKWILVGDVRQLSPFTETLHLRVNLEGLLGNRDLEISHLIFLKLIFDKTKKRSKRKEKESKFPPPVKYLYIDDYGVIKATHKLLVDRISWDVKQPPDDRRFDHLEFAFLTEQELPDIGLPGIFLFSPDSLKSRKFTLLNKNMIFVEKEVYERQRDDMPSTHLLIYPNNPFDGDKLEFRHGYWRNLHRYWPYSYQLPKGVWTKDPNLIKEDILSALQKYWAGELAWRMKRVYELQLLVESERSERAISYYEISMRALLPSERNENREIWRNIKKIAQISFPSILTSLQEGVTKFYRADEHKTVLSSGFRDTVKADRHEILVYQHRMHPEISALARSLFYKKIGALQDVGVITEGGIRDWTFDEYQGKRLVWKHVPGEYARVHRNTNEEEAQSVLHELKKLLAWIKSKENEGKPPTVKSVMLLTFYNKQRERIRDLIRSHYPEQGNPRKQTRFRIGNVRVYCYTVDKVQGREADVVYLSMVQNKRIGFMDSPNRLNVAITRPKFLQVIVGDQEFFSEKQRSSDELQEIARRLPRIIEG